MLINNLNPVAFEIFFIKIHWYSLAYIFGIICGWIYIKKILIKNNIHKVEAGAQGEHKISRGYLPSFVYSIHWFSNVAFGNAISDYLDKEEKIINDEYNILMKTSPFKQ